MTFWTRVVAGLVLVGMGCFVGGCGGGAARISGPNGGTSAGLGTLIVRVAGVGNSGVVFLQKLARPTREGVATFTDIPPGRYPVTASAPGFFQASQNVDILADKTVSISLSPTPQFGTPRPTPF